MPAAGFAGKGCCYLEAGGGLAVKAGDSFFNGRIR